MYVFSTLSTTLAECFLQLKTIDFTYLFILTNLLYINGNRKENPFGNSSKHKLCTGTHKGHRYWALFLLQRNSVNKQTLNVKNLLFLFWHLLCLFWSNTQYKQVSKNNYSKPLYSAADLSKSQFQKWNQSVAEYISRNAATSKY